MAEMEESLTAAAPRDSISGVSFSSGSCGSSMSNSFSSSSISIKTALNECSAAWITYLNVLNKLCAAGNQLANMIAVLEQCQCGTNEKQKGTSQNHPTSHLTNSWNDLSRATAVATSTVKSHIIGVLQDFVPVVDQSSTICEKEQKRIREHNELIALENSQTLINIQHQFCAASYDAFSTLTCCFVCQAPVGYPHEQECTMIKQKSHLEQRSQTPSPHFGCSHKIETSRGNSLNDQRPHTIGSIQLPEHVNYGIDQTCGPSPQHNLRDAIPLQAIFENTRGPLPNPGQLLAMKNSFYRGGKSPLNCLLFPLNGQRRWSEAAAGEVTDDISTDVESQMRRWSMPWEASKTDQNTVTWYQTRIMPINFLKFTNQKMYGIERSNSNTPDLNWQSSITSQDGLTEAIQLLSCKPARYHHTLNTQQSHTLPPPDMSTTD